MAYITDASAPAASRQTNVRITRNFVELLGHFLSDAETDSSVAARDLALSEASFIRLRRARDRVACTQTLLETVSEIAGKAADAAGTSPTGSEAEIDLGTIAAAMREAVELLARGWPEHYPAGAVEWLLVASIDSKTQ